MPGDSHTQSDMSEFVPIVEGSFPLFPTVRVWEGYLEEEELRRPQRAANSLTR
jgi:hypothetical protein